MPLEINFTVFFHHYYLNDSETFHIFPISLTLQPLIFKQHQISDFRTFFQHLKRRVYLFNTKTLFKPHQISYVTAQKSTLSSKPARLSPNTTDFRQTERQVKIGVYLELGHRGHSIPSGGKLSSKLEANKAALHKLINQQRQINTDKHRGHFCPFQSFIGVENNAVSNLWTLWDINITNKYKTSLLIIRIGCMLSHRNSQIELWWEPC